MEDILPTLLVVLIASVGAFRMQREVWSARHRSLFMLAFGVHVVAVLANLAVVYRLYGGRGDMFAFLTDGREIALAVREDPVGMFPELVRLYLHFPSLLERLSRGTVATHSMTAIAGLGCLLFQDSMLAISMCCGMASFFGKALLFLTFRNFLPKVWEREVLICCMLVPTVVFWSAGLIKESFVITGFGFGAFGVYRALRRDPVGLALGVFGISLVAFVKPYMVMSSTAGLVSYVYWSRAVQGGQLKVRPLRLIGAVGVGLFALVLIGALFPRFALSNLLHETARLSQAGQRGGSSFSLGVDFTGASSATLALYAVPAMFTALFRPAFFDVSNAQVAVNALETTAVLWFFIQMVRKHGLWGTLRLPIRYPILGFCIPMVMVTAFGVGISTGNLGTLSRYRMPLMPFFALWIMVGVQAAPELLKSTRKAARKIRAVGRGSA